MPLKRYSPDQTFLSWLLLILLSFIWGSSYILIKKGLLAFSPVQLAGVRLGVSSLAFVPVYLSLHKKTDWKRWKSFLVVALAGSGIPAFLFALAQTQLNSSLTGILNALTPLTTFILGFLFFGLVFKWSKLLGVIIGFAGAFLLIWVGKESGAAGNIWYAVPVVLASVCYALSANEVGFKLRDVNSLVISAASFMLLLIPGWFLIFYTGVPTTVMTHPDGWTSLGFVCILAISSTFIATILFFRLIQMTGTVFSSFVSYIAPVVAAGWGILDGESVTFSLLLGMALILAGVYVAKK